MFASKVNLFKSTLPIALPISIVRKHINDKKTKIKAEILHLLLYISLTFLDILDILNVLIIFVS